MRRRRAFTLIELLVVISIIALLIGILLPALGAARSAARAAACLSNMRQVSIAVLTYAQDHDQRLPQATIGHGLPHGAEQGSWLFTLKEYAGDTSILARCPSDRSEHFDVPEPSSGSLRRVSYGMNFFLSGRMAHRQAYANLDALPNPSATIFASELAETGKFAAADHIHPEWFYTRPGGIEKNAREQVAIDRHNGRSNYSFLDGHAAAHDVTETMDLGAGATPVNLKWNANKYDPAVAH